MSIFDFLNKVFFCRTEKSGTKTQFYCCIENGKETILLFLLFLLFFRIFGNMRNSLATLWLDYVM
jgi:hypothetical protein